MNAEAFREFCLKLPHVSESLPFDEVTLVFKICSLKIFAILPLDTPDRVNLKCNPERATELRESFAAVVPGYHSNKKHWNTVYFNSDIDDKTLIDLVNHSYELVWNNLPKKIRNNL